jgi:hypothetical protein
MPPDANFTSTGQARGKQAPSCLKQNIPARLPRSVDTKFSALRYDRGEGRRQWRHLDAGVLRVWIEAKAPRITCGVDGC